MNENTNQKIKSALRIALERILFSNERTPLLAWVVVPFLIAWISVGYLLGVVHQTEWDTARGKDTEAMAQAEISPQFMQSIPEIIWRGQGLVTLWFDDAWLSQYTNTISVLEEHKLTASLAVPTRLIGLEGYMSWAQVKRLQFLGWEITAHSRTHNCNTAEHSEQFAADEVKGSFDDLASHGIFTEHYVLPCGALTPVLDNEIRKHYSSSRTTESGLNELPLQDKYRIKVKQIDPKTTQQDIDAWLAEAKTNGRWLVLMFHQIDESGSEYSATPTMLKNIAASIKAANLEVVLPSQAIGITKKQ